MAQTDEEKRAAASKAQALADRKREEDRRVAIKKAQKAAEATAHRPLVTS